MNAFVWIVIGFVDARVCLLIKGFVVVRVSRCCMFKAVLLGKFSCDCFAQLGLFDGLALF